MELRNKAKEILARLIRNRFDATSIYERQALASLIAIARECELYELAAEMQLDLDFELTNRRKTA